MHILGIGSTTTMRISGRGGEKEPGARFYSGFVDGLEKT